MDKKGVTLIELIIVVAIIGILAMIAVPAYIGQQKNAARTEAYGNLQNLRLLEEQFFAENGRYTITLGTCAAGNPGNIIQYRLAVETLLMPYQASSQAPEQAIVIVYNKILTLMALSLHHVLEHLLLAIQAQGSLTIYFA